MVIMVSHFCSTCLLSDTQLELEFGLIHYQFTSLFSLLLSYYIVITISFLFSNFSSCAVPIIVDVRMKYELEALRKSFSNDITIVIRIQTTNQARINRKVEV